jgi:competence protein ComEA
MLNLTRQERQVILFLLSIALTGAAINYSLKINPRIKRIVKAESDDIKFDLNQVAPQELYASRIIPQKLARKIIDYRNVRGKFRNLEELKDIKGIGTHRYNKLKEIFFIP